MRTLICNADDYGLSPAVSRGILAAAQGVVRATSAMANFITSAEADALSGSGLSVAAHLNLSTGPPLSADYPAELLDARGWFDKTKALDEVTWERDAHVAAARREWAAQLARLAELGVAIDHLDSHHHTHTLPGLLPAALGLAGELGLPLRARRGCIARVRAAGIACPDDFVEAYFGYNNIGAAGLRAALADARGEVVELMCHPGAADAPLRERSGYVEERELELSVLGDPALARALEDDGWMLAGYAAVR